jgi:hypothetical protein
MIAPRSHLALTPALQYGFSLPGGFGAQAVARYALDLYPESVWDWVPMPDSLDPSRVDGAGLAFNRADGRFYAYALAEEGGLVRESFGSVPLQRRKARRLDQRAGLEFSLWRSLPQGYSLAMETSAELGWSNLPRTSPIESQPWRFALAFTLTRSSSR